MGSRGGKCETREQNLELFQLIMAGREEPAAQESPKEPDAVPRGERSPGPLDGDADPPVSQNNFGAHLQTAQPL